MSTILALIRRALIITLRDSNLVAADKVIEFGERRMNRGIESLSR
jgi:hypothetical protein